jgi:hypothetical protein
LEIDIEKLEKQGEDKINDLKENVKRMESMKEELRIKIIEKKGM